jgi:hypothetical protein
MLGRGGGDRDTLDKLALLAGLDEVEYIVVAWSDRKSRLDRERLNLTALRLEPFELPPLDDEAYNAQSVPGQADDQEYHGRSGTGSQMQAVTR